MLSTQKCVCLFQQSLKIPNSLIRQQSSLLFSLSNLSSNVQVYNQHKTHQLIKHSQLQSPLHSIQYSPLLVQNMQYATKKMETKQGQAEEKDASETKPAEPTTYKEKLKQAMSQYGSTVIIFHITISLISLGTCYLLVQSGLDMSALLEKLGLSEKSVNKLASSSGTFAAAYLIHKVFAPVRLSITLTCTPFIVRYLRKAGFIKKALPKVEPKKGL
ncbi:protein FAM210B, mitochondrial-like isoform X1 [Atheta coriaria]|uniref:protein FAM210B, mitochondrial-like isoform X1 n=1 Tax=Dalotia coriaria TaxID=877792 RepID=UPI0031F379CB